MKYCKSRCSCPVLGLLWAVLPAVGLLGTSFLAVVVAGPAAARAADEPQDRTVSLAGGKLQLTAPEGWQKKKPQNNIIEYEFGIPKSAGDEQDGRATLMGAGGSVDANVKRWSGQFKQPDGGEAQAKVKEEKLAGQTVHLIDISGTYDDKPPFSGTGVQRKGYRMLAAIVESKDLGNYFIKFYGPEQTVADNEKAFDKMIHSLERK